MGVTESFGFRTYRLVLFGIQMYGREPGVVKKLHKKEENCRFFCRRFSSLGETCA